MRIRTISLSLLVSGALVLTAVPVGAGLSGAEERFCEATTDISQDLSQDLSDNSGAGDAADYYRELAKVAPKKSIKKALKTMATYYDDFADIDADSADDVQDFLTSTTYRRFAKATTRISTYILDTCLQANL